MVRLGLRQKWRKIQKHLQFRRELAVFKRNLIRDGYKSSLAQPTATAILLSYARPQNLQWIIQSLLRCEFIEKVIVSNNNPSTKLEKWVPITDSRL